MAADVSREMKGEGKPGPGDPFTRDFLGGCFGTESKELDLDLHVPTGWEKRLDLQTGKVYIQRCISQSPTPDHKNTNPINQTAPSSSNVRNQTVNYHVETAPPNLDLNLFSNLPSNSLTIHKNALYQSVCTLDKVKSALERAWKDSSSPNTSSSKKRSSPSNSDTLMISITNNNEDLNSNSSSGDHNQNEKDESDENGMLVAGACPSCLLYVLISTTKPKCPKCNSDIPLPTPSKKPKIDLNM